MSKAKILLGLGAALCAMSITTVPSSAWYSGTNNPTGSSFGSGGFDLTIPGGMTVMCNVAVGSWRIQDSKAAQDITKQGPHLQQEITFEGKPFSKTIVKNCEALMGGLRVQVRPIRGNFQIKQPTKGTFKGFTVTVISKSAIEIVGLSCELFIPPKGNEELKEVSGTNGTKGIKLTPNVSGITVEVNAACEKEAGIKGGKEGKFAIEAGNVNEAEGVSLI